MIKMNNTIVGWISALVIVLPVTFTFGWLALFGAFIGVSDIYDVWTKAHTWNTEVSASNYFFALTGVGGIIGISGLWIGSIFYGYLTKERRMLGVIVSIFLVIGGISAITIVIFLFQADGSNDLTSIFLLGWLIFVAIYAVILIKNILTPDISIQEE